MMMLFTSVKLVDGRNPGEIHIPLLTLTYGEVSCKEKPEEEIMLSLQVTYTSPHSKLDNDMSVSRSHIGVPHATYKNTSVSVRHLFSLPIKNF